jgi:hypothetical protein
MPIRNQHLHLTKQKTNATFHAFTFDLPLGGYWCGLIIKLY